MSGKHRPRRQLALWDLQKQFGHSVIAPATQTERIAPIATGIPALDQILTGGGIARGRLTELIGVPTSGVTTLAYKIAGQAQTTDGTLVYLDLSGTFDPDYALRCGLMLERLLIIQPADAIQALDIARDLFQFGALALIVLDFGQAAHPLPEKALRRMHDILKKSSTAALWLQSVQRPELDAITHTRLQVARQTWLYQGQDIRGYRVQVTVLKDASGKRNESVSVDLTFDDSIQGGVP